MINNEYICLTRKQILQNISEKNKSVDFFQDFKENDPNLLKNVCDKWIEIYNFFLKNIQISIECSCYTDEKEKKKSVEESS